MEAAYKFAVSGETMDFALDQHQKQTSYTPCPLYRSNIVEKCQLINHHFLNTRDHLRIVANVTDPTATIKFHDTKLNDSELKIVTISNASDLERQLIHLWREVQLLLRFYHEDDRIAELASIDTYYSSFAYNRMIAQHFMYEFF